VSWAVEYTEVFEQWWNGLTAAEQVAVAAHVEVLEERGPHVPYPYSSAVRASRHGHLRELRVQHAGRPYRVLYAFDPRRTAILLLGGDKTGDPRWYATHVPIADRLYDAHLETLRREGLADGQEVQ
jgi:hypothetical protein